MRKIICCWTIVFLVSVGARSPAAENTSSSQKKSIAYLGIGYLDDLPIPPHHLKAVELNIRKNLELPRFEYIEISPEKHVTIDQFMEAYRSLVHQSAADASGGVRPAWADSAERIINSAFFYQITVTTYQIDVIESLALTEARVYLNAQVDFFRLNLSDPQQPAYILEASIIPGAPTSLREQLTIIADGHSQLDELLARCAHSLGRSLSIAMRRLPAFRLRAKIEKVEADGVRLPLGHGMGVYVDMGFNVVRAGESGEPERVGYVKVRDVAENSSYAETISSSSGWSFAGDEDLVEHAMHGIGVKLSGITEMVFQGLLGEQEARFYPGFALTAEIDVGQYIGWPEFYATVDMDMLFLGEPPGMDLFFSMLHVCLGAEKRWYIHRLALAVGARFGFSKYIFEDENISGESASFGVGADAYLGLEFFIVPEFSLFARAMGRVFVNPLIDWVQDAQNEIGVLAHFGASMSF